MFLIPTNSGRCKTNRPCHTIHVHSNLLVLSSKSLRASCLGINIPKWNKMAKHV